MQRDKEIEWRGDRQKKTKTETNTDIKTKREREREKERQRVKLTHILRNRSEREGGRGGSRVR